jgi:hypothetical protein
MIAGSSAREREGLERHQWVVEGGLLRTFVILGRRSGFWSHRSVVAETFLIDKGLAVSPFCPRLCEDLGKQPIGERRTGSHWVAIVKEEDNGRAINND